jgi:hypothetical protein
MSRARFLLAPQNIYAHTTCLAHAYAFVCLYTVTTPSTHTESGPLPSMELQKSTSLSCAFSLPAKTQSAFERTVNVLSP